MEMGAFSSSASHFAITILLITNLHARADVSILMSRGDLAGSGANLAETILSPQAVGSGNFGKLASLQVEGFVYAQPLIAAGVQAAGKTRNVLYIATMENVVYAFDADDFSSSGGLLWQVRFSDGGAIPIPNADLFAGGQDSQRGAVLKGSIGIMSTPVIDSVSGTIFALSRWKRGGIYGQSLHALDITTGAEKPNSPVDVAFTDSSGAWTFDPKIEGQRPGLEIVGGNVIVAWASLQDMGLYHGWIMAFDKATLARVGVFCSSCGPTTGIAAPFGAGFWQSGRAPAADAAGSIYLFSGNGWPTGNIGGNNYWSSSCVDGAPPAGYYGESVIKLNPSNLSAGSSLQPPVASVLPANWCTSLDKEDLDLGGSGPLLITENQRNLLVGGGKEGILNLLDANALVKPSVVGGAQIQTLQVAPPDSCDHHIMGGPIYWNRTVGAAGAAPNSSLLFISVESDYLRSYSLGFSSSGAPSLSFISAGPTKILGHPGGMLTLSANSNIRHSGVIWLSHAKNTSCDFASSAVSDVKPGALRAYDADNIMQEIWSSDSNSARDALGYFSKFTPPTVANGKVYMATSPTPETYYTPSPPYTYYAGTVYSMIQVYGINPPSNPPAVRNNAILLAPIVSLAIQ